MGVSGLFIEIPTDEEDTWPLEPILEIRDKDDAPIDLNAPEGIDWSQWRGPIYAPNVAYLTFLRQAKTDIESLIAEIERLRRLVAVS